MTRNCQCCSSVYISLYRVTYQTEWHATLSVAVLYISVCTVWHIRQNDTQLSVLQFCIYQPVPCDISDRMTRNCQCCSSVYISLYRVTYQTEWHATLIPTPSNFARNYSVPTVLVYTISICWRLLKAFKISPAPKLWSCPTFLSPVTNRRPLSFLDSFVQTNFLTCDQ